MSNQVQDTNYHIHVDSSHSFLTFNLKETWNYRDLIWLFTKKNLLVRYKQTVLGPLWLILSPTMTSIMYTIFFGTVAGIDTEGLPKIMFYLAMNGLWSYFSIVFFRCADLFRNHAYIFGNVYFPRLVMAFSEMLVSVIEFLIQLPVLVILCVWYSFHGMAIPYITWFWIVIILCWVGMMAMGCGILVSSFTTKYRDLRILVGYVVRLWMYATPVVYPLSILNPGWLRTLELLNPLTYPMEFFRKMVLGVGGAPVYSLVISVVFTVVAAVLGILVFNKMERNFMDTV